MHCRKLSAEVKHLDLPHSICSSIRSLPSVTGCFPARVLLAFYIKRLLGLAYAPMLISSDTLFFSLAHVSEQPPYHVRALALGPCGLRGRSIGWHRR